MVLGALGTAVLGFAVGTFAPLGEKLVDGLIDVDRVADAARADAPIRTVVEVIDNDADQGATGTFAFRDPLVFTAEEKAVLADFGTQQDALGNYLDPYTDEFFSLVNRRGGTKIGAFHGLVTLHGKREQTVRLTDMRISFVERGEPLAGGKLCDPTAGGGPVEKVEFDLDKQNPVPQYVNEETGEPSGPYFSRRAVTLAKDEQVTIHVVARTQEHFARFRLAIEYEVGDERGTLTVDDAGEPFRVTAPPTRYDANYELIPPVRPYATMWERDIGGPFQEVTDPAERVVC